MTALLEGDYSRAARLLDDTLAIRQDMRDRFGESIVHAYRGAVARMIGELDYAETILTEGIRLAYDVGNQYAIAHYLVEIGLLSASRAQWTRAAFFLSAAAQLIGRVGVRHVAVAEGEFEAVLEVARGHLPDSDFRDAESRAQSMTLAQVIFEALELTI